MLRLWRRIALVPAAAVLVVAGLGGTAGHSATSTASRLVAFRSCGDLLGYVKSQAAPLVSPWGFGRSPLIRGGLPPGVAIPGAAAKTSDTTPTQGVDYSGTNVQEQGVDEPDSVKTNGTTLFAVAGGRLNAVDVTGTRPRLLDSLTLDAGWSHELLLAGDRLLVLSRGGYWLTPLPAATAIAMPYFPAKSVLSEIDVSNPKALRLVRTLTLDGGYVDARLVGSTARIVVSSQVPTKLPFEQPVESTNAALATAREPQPGGRPLLAPRLVAPDLHDQARRPSRAGRAAARPVPERRPPAAVLGPRDADGAHRRHGQGPRPGGLDQRDDRRADRLRLTRQSVPRNRALDGAAAAGDADGAAAERDCHHRDPPLRHLRPGAHALPRQRPGRGLPAEPVVAVGVQRRAARREHERTRVVRLERFERVVADDAAPRGRCAHADRTASATSARATASTR